MKKIAITGNIAAGKTTVENYIINEGYDVIDADNICHNAFNNNKIVKDKIINLFRGYDILMPDGNINRKSVGEIVFSDTEYKKQLEDIIHPFVKEEIDNFFVLHSSKKIVFASIPLLFETNMQSNYDKIILVCGDEDIRLQRIIKRNKCSKEHAQARINSQITQKEKIKLSDYIIENNTTLVDLHYNTLNILRAIAKS